MKKIYIIAGLFLLASCETVLIPEPMGPDRQISLQARIMTTDTIHTVYAAYSKRDTLEQAKDLTIACYVNGECVATTSESEVVKDYAGFETACRSYRFRADIHPGDSVRIEAIGPSDRAIARVKAPDAAPVPEVTVEKIPSISGRSHENMYRFRIHVKDQPGKRNWYRLETLGRQVLNEHRPAGYPNYYWGWTEEGGWYCVIDNTQVIPVDNTMDSFLNPEARVVDRSNKDYLANEYNYFTDELFEDGSVDLTLETQVYRYFHFNTMESIPVCTYQGLFYAFFDLQNLSREDYLNSRMQEMQYLSLTGVDWVDGLFSEDQVLPCNVEGGIGLVTVRSVSRAVLFLGEKTGDPFDWPEE
jgi:hypothetical protein